ncbi:MAG: hypothetical protein GY834_09865, partial [Bacteroidetes bacterium]|nr:hypothetical protein [Bacteroidota bacterium]
RVATYTINEIPHEAVVLYNGPLEDQNPKNFDYKIYVEPQNDQIQKIGSSSLNQIAHEVWHGYFNHPFEGWQYMALPLCKYSLSNGQATLTYDNSNLVTSWEPFRNNGVEDKSIQYPVSRTLEANPNVLAEAAQIVEDSEVTGILYTHHTQLNRTTTSNQDSDPTKPGHYNFEIGVTDHAKAGKYEDEGYWNITVADTESPVYNSVFKNWSDASGSPVNVTTGRDTTNKSCDGLVGKANEYEVGTDATGNSLEVLTSESDFDNRVMPVYVSSPADVEYVGNPNDANPLPDLTGAPVFSHPTGNVEINYSDETMRESSGEKDIKRTFNGTSERSDCEVSP